MKAIFKFLLLLFLINIDVLQGGLVFSNRSSSILISPGGKLYLQDTNSIAGWSRESIVQTSGNNSPINWDPSWTGDNSITYQVAPEPFLPENRGDITLQVYYHELKTDLLLGPNRHFIIQSSPSTNYTFIQGNGYTINLAEGFSNLIQIEAGQTVEIANTVIKNYDENGIYLPAGATLKFLNSTIEITDNRALYKPLNLAGEVIINGYGYTVSMNPGAYVNIDAGQLTINNVVFYGIGGQNLACKTADTNLILQNCNLFLTDNYRFKNGGLQMIDSTISGFEGFNFESSQTFSISRTVMFDTGITFSYSPSNDRRDLLYMDDSSILYLNGCTLRTTITGMQLTTGTLIVNGQNHVYNDGAVSLSQAFLLGNGNPANDLDIEILPGASISLESGKLLYANVNL
ncbi:MAG: hypothetical protein US49_C0001G0049 [candidate division TM6 bacterium GW2011_GWF2_37_49]|nr:MAG: hypothetical protein US49_C0001G0049 [candidate division TM6 bacterium GW2011_GWF2_37_49]